jgi:hypothetical protein
MTSRRTYFQGDNQLQAPKKTNLSGDNLCLSLISLKVYRISMAISFSFLWDGAICFFLLIFSEIISTPELEQPASQWLYFLPGAEEILFYLCSTINFPLNPRVRPFDGTPSLETISTWELISPFQLAVLSFCVFSQSWWYPLLLMLCNRFCLLSLFTQRNPLRFLSA